MSNEHASTNPDTNPRDGVDYDPGLDPDRDQDFCENTAYPECPECGWQKEHDYEMNEDHFDRVECGRCGKTFLSMMLIETWFVNERLDEDDPDPPEALLAAEKANIHDTPWAVSMMVAEHVLQARAAMDEQDGAYSTAEDPDGYVSSILCSLINHCRHHGLSFEEDLETARNAAEDDINEIKARTS